MSLSKPANDYLKRLIEAGAQYRTIHGKAAYFNQYGKPKFPFSEELYFYILHFSEEEFFQKHPPKTLSTKGTKTFQAKCECKQCGKPTKFQGWSRGYNNFCSSRCGVQHMADTEGAEGRKARMAKLQQTMIARYGAHASVLVPEIAEKLKLKERFLDPEIIRKSKATRLERYGHEWNCSPEQLKRRSQTFKETLAKNPKLWSNSHYQRTSCRVDGREFKLQGYEHIVLRRLCKSGQVNVQTVETSPMTIPYMDGAKERLYIPDFKFKLRGRWVIAEVKSTYTAGLEKANKTLFYNMRRKARAVVNTGLVFVLFIYDERSGKLHEVRDLPDLSRKELKELVLEARTHPQEGL